MKDILMGEAIVEREICTYKADKNTNSIMPNTQLTHTSSEIFMRKC